MIIQKTLSAADCEALGIPAEYSDKPLQISIKPNDPTKRTEYMRAYRGVVTKYFADKLGESKDEAHEYIMVHLLPVVNYDPEDGFSIVGGSMDTMTHTEIKNLMDRAERLAFHLFNEMPPRRFEI